ncbi:Rap1a/Tai family immunity protein [Polynucleobacter sp. MWH-UH23A]|uniref:Rap1a/Tai family immunity protein n=1 Tax=Polynucleobacter sp. MWH-UH23A TaxID=1855613 RepID=UPI0033652D4A
MKYRLYILASSLYVMATAQAVAQEKIRVPSTQEVISTCKTPSSPESRSFCIGYVTAVYDSYMVSRKPKKVESLICMNQPASTRDEVIADLTKWSDKHPEYAMEPAAGNILRFFSERFPCKKSVKR